MLTILLNKWMRLFLILAWPSSVWATALTFGESVSKITPLEWFLVCLLSTLSGLTSLLIRVSNEINANPPRTIRHPFIFGGAHMLGSWLAGVMTFFSAAQFGFYGFSIGVAVPAIAFGGAASCEWFMRRAMGTNISVPAITPQDPVTPAQ